jgi:hypothetical protein
MESLKDLRAGEFDLSTENTVACSQCSIYFFGGHPFHRRGCRNQRIVRYRVLFEAYWPMPSPEDASVLVTVQETPSTVARWFRTPHVTVGELRDTLLRRAPHWVTCGVKAAEAAITRQRAASHKGDRP